MAYDLEEQEKLDALRDWWAQYGTLIVALLLAAAAAVAGWRGWQWYQSHQANQAMGYFEALQSAAAGTDDEALARLQAASTTLRNDFPRSGYTSRGMVVAAQALHQRGDAKKAAELLQWLINSKSPDTAYINLARLRLAGIWLEQKQYDQALALLENPSQAFQGLYADRRGDIFYAQGKNQDAIQQWEQALKELGSDPITQIVQLKLDALAGA